MEWNQQHCAEGDGGERLGSPPPPFPQRRGPPRPPQSCRCQRSSWGASRAESGGGSRAPCAHPTPSCCSPQDPQGAPPARPSLTRLPGMRANGARSPRGPALLPTPPPAHGGRADKGASWRPRLAVAVGGLNPAPGLTFGAGSTAAPRACSPDRPHRPAPLVHPPPPPRPGPAAVPRLI